MGFCAFCLHATRGQYLDGVVLTLFLELQFGLVG